MKTDSAPKSLSEFEIIEQFFKRPSCHPAVAKAIGDDCAILNLPENHQLVVSMDTLVAGRHFPASATATQIATRAFCTCLSDLAAMGAQPAWFTLGLTLPEANSAWLQDFSQALLAIADDHQCSLVGGDTTRGPLVITLQVHGLVTSGKALTRDSARPGDRVLVTGTLGDGAAALAVIENRADPISLRGKNYLLQRFYQPQPQIAAGLLLTGHANAAIDISDGLLADLQHIASASRVDIDIDSQKIPLSSACQMAAGEQALAYALRGGDDYQLAFTVPAAQKQAIQTLIQTGELQASDIGCVVTCRNSQPAVRCFSKGQLITPTEPLGYQHFAP